MAPQGRVWYVADHCDDFVYEENSNLRDDVKLIASVSNHWGREGSTFFTISYIGVAKVS
jgi:hypothetical protein